MFSFEIIEKYKMSQDEIKAYKIAALYCELCQSLFPNERTAKMAANKDPRKTTLFKYAYKLTIETRGLIPDNEYRLYIRAQLEILKQISDGKVHAMITPQCLVGQKAWTRWLMWKKRYDKMAYKPQTAIEAGVTANKRLIIGELNSTIRFLRTQGGYELSWLIQKMNSGDILKWLTNASISPYFLAFHKELNNNIDDFKDFGIIIDDYLSYKDDALVDECWNLIDEQSKYSQNK